MQNKSYNSSNDSQPLRILNPKFKELRSLIESLRLRGQLLDLKASVLGGAYIIFQALMYGLVTLSSAAAPPQNLWFPTCLSASVSLLFWPAFVDTVNNCMRTRQQQESSFVEQDKVYRKICSVHNDRPHGAAAVASSQRSLSTAFATVRRLRQAYVWVLYFGLLLLTLCVPCVTLNQAHDSQRQELSYSFDSINNVSYFMGRVIKA